MCRCCCQSPSLSLLIKGRARAIVFAWISWEFPPMHRPPDRSKNFTLRVGKRLNEKAIVLETRLDLVMKSYTKSRCNQAPVWYGGDEEQKRIPCYGRLTNKWKNRDYQIIERRVGMEQTARIGSVHFLPPPSSVISHSCYTAVVRVRSMFTLAWVWI